MMIIGIAADHGGFALKENIYDFLKQKGYTVTDFGAHKLDNTDDYPDLIIPLALGVASGKIDLGIAVCGSGVGAAIAANKIAGVRAALINDYFTAHQGVEDDDMNLICLGGRVVGNRLAEDLISSFLNARFIGGERHLRRLEKIKALEET